MFVRGEIDGRPLRSSSEQAPACSRTPTGGSFSIFPKRPPWISRARATERLSRLASDTGGRFVVVAVTPGVHRILALASHPWLAVTGDLDTALETVSDRAGASS